ncbi:4161_t:CDS:2 [Funneliformis mosseae]|uniref:4161_t:CDS:1 n=1 Tax=Funneliformis mosseae TaxID=27381 RepID=A0A9N8WLQ0_FUNMO|nr:4161_t:CDS:2 [Funneliformis mosseae]
MVNQTRQEVLHSCKWGGCKEKFNSNLSLWKHVEQHVDNAIPRLTHMVNDDDDAPAAPVTAQYNNNTGMTSNNSAATSRVNRSHIVQPHTNTGRINPTMNVNLMRPVLNLQSSHQTRPPQLQQVSHMLTQVSPTITYNTIGVPQFVNTSQRNQPSAGQIQIQTAYQQHLSTSAQKPQLQQRHHPSVFTSLLALQYSQQQQQISNFVMDVDSPVNVNHQRLGRPPAFTNNDSVRATQMQKKVVNLNMNSQFLSQNTKK